MSIERPFRAVEQRVHEEVKPIVINFLWAAAFVTFFCILFAAKISVAVTKPMMILLQIVEQVNAGRIEDDLPPMQGGSREVNQVYTSFAKLYKIVKMSNTAFFSGDFFWALHIATDALKLFRKIQDEKAIAIACNNVGNTFLALSIQDRTPGKCKCVDGICCARSAIEHFNEAIDIGQREFDAGESDATKAEFAQQLADRYLNRAICLLQSLDDPCLPDNASEVAYADLIRCRDYDRGVREYFMYAKLMFKNSDVCFERSIRRLYALASIGELDSGVWQLFDTNEFINRTDLLLQASWNTEDAPLFKSLTRVGRLQQLEGAVIGVEMSYGNAEDAAKIAMRMLIEDEYILESSFAFAADAVQQVMKENQNNNTASSWPKSAITGTRYEFQRMRKLGKMNSLDLGKCFIFCIEISDSSIDDDSRSILLEKCLEFYDEQCGANDTFGLVGLTNKVDSNFSVNIGPRESQSTEQREGIQKAILDYSSRAKTGSYPALPTAVNLIVESAKSNAQDAVLLYVTDGTIWDKHSFEIMEKKISESNCRRTSNIDIISIGIGVKEGNEFARQCNDLCLSAKSRQSRSYCCDVDLDQIEGTFDVARSNLTSPTTSSANNSRSLLGLTMEKF